MKSNSRNVSYQLWTRNPFLLPNPSTLTKKNVMQHPESGISGRNILPDHNLSALNQVCHWLITLAAQLSCYGKLRLRKEIALEKNTITIWWLWDKGVQGFLYCYSSKLGMKFIICLLKRILSPSKSSSHLSKILFILGPMSFAHTWFVLIVKNNHWVLRENENPDLQRLETFQLDTRNIWRYEQ